MWKKSRNTIPLKQIAVVLFSLFLINCSKEENKESTTSDNTANTTASSPAETASASPAAVDENNDMGIGPIKTAVTLGPIDNKLVAEGKKTFEMKCAVCHNIDTKKVGPALKGVTKRRRPEWIMNQILNPGEMTQKDPIAKKLLAQYMTQMANQNVGEKGARDILEYFRSNDK